MKKKEIKCKAQGCKNKATLLSPTYLCLAHWQWWFLSPVSNSQAALRMVLRNRFITENTNMEEKEKTPKICTPTQGGYDLMEWTFECSPSKYAMFEHGMEPNYCPYCGKLIEENHERLPATSDR